MQQHLQKLKNQIKNVMQTHKKKFEKTIIETNSRINKLLKTIQNKKKIIDFLKTKLVDESQISMKSENNKQSTEFETKSDILHFSTKKVIKMIIFS